MGMTVHHEKTPSIATDTAVATFGVQVDERCFQRRAECTRSTPAPSVSALRYHHLHTHTGLHLGCVLGIINLSVDYHDRLAALIVQV